MDVDLILTPEARQDLDEIYAWYEARRIGTGEVFFLKVDACFAAIQRNPEMHPIAVGNYRRALVRTFPYVLIYDYEDGSVTVYGCFHTSRDRKKWLGRLP
jgi:plasmid stabilization system protein ParE